MKENGVLGDHWHAKKDEVFLLLSGSAGLVVIGEEHWGGTPGSPVLAPYRWEVPRGTYHAFHLAKGSVILGAATEIYDKDDERTDLR